SARSPTITSHTLDVYLRLLLTIFLPITLPTFLSSRKLPIFVITYFLNSSFLFSLFSYLTNSLSALSHCAQTRLVSEFFRADVEIRKFIDPQMVDCGCDVFVGEMTISLSSAWNFNTNPIRRRVSLSEDAATVVLEFSNDFLA
ncbi:unnamed protein product, partial [Gongylonema pulchrum]|uniref:Neur_chan_LBD domain-containing protein n=1 Tax=Gongylonema pulchrum TaxID=637853 RepID=A0A183CUB7_9BILA